MNRKNILGRLKNDLAEKFSTTWRLLSETTQFLSRAELLPKYEPMLRRWRHTLEGNRSNTEKIQTVREEIVGLRRELRKSGYDLTLGNRDIKIEGYRNDAAMSDGFVRLVIAVSNAGVFSITGQDNHTLLYRYLSDHLKRKNVYGQTAYHFLWYRWRNNVLVLSGADSETRDNFERFKEYVEKNKMVLLKYLKRLP
jgi:hypothetical protein